MSAAYPMDHHRPAHRVPRQRPDLLPALVVAVVIVLLLIAAWFALKVSAERALTASIYELTEQAIRTQTPACSVEVVAGIKVRHCIQTVAQ